MYKTKKNYPHLYYVFHVVTIIIIIEKRSNHHRIKVPSYATATPIIKPTPRKYINFNSSNCAYAYGFFVQKKNSCVICVIVVTNERSLNKCLDYCLRNFFNTFFFMITKWVEYFR